MTVLYSNDFEAETLGTTPAGWVVGVGGVHVVTATDAVGGSKALGRSDDAYASLYTGIAAVADMGIRSDQKARFDGTAYAHTGHVMRSNATYASGAYLVLLKSTDGANLFVEFFQYIGFHVSLGASANVISVVAGDTVHFYTDVIGTTLRAYVWKNADTKPASPTYTITDSGVTAAGYAGVRVSSPTLTMRAADNIVITDGAGGDGLFDVVAPIITGPSGAAGAATSTANLAELATTGPTFTTSVALGVGYPTLTGADAASFTLTALSSTSWRVDPVTPFNLEAGGLVNPQAIVFNASASVSQSCSVTVTNVNEAPTFSGTVSVPTLTQGSAMTPVNAGALFSDPDSGDTAAYSAVGVWPAGVTVDSSTGIISGTPSAAATYANLRVRRTDAGSLTADSNLFTITVAASGGVTFSGTVPAQSGTVGTAFSLALASYFSGTGTYAVQAGTLPTGLSLDSSTGAITGTPSAAGTFSGVVIRKTAASGSPATADTNAFAFTIAAAPAVAGFDLDTAAGCVFGAIAGALTSISREVGVAYKVAVYNTSTRALIFESGSLTTGSNGRLPRFTTNLVTVGVTYDLVAKRVSDGAIASFRLAAS